MLQAIIKQNKLYCYFTLAVLFLFMLPSMFQKGMFLDGVTYAAISNNLALGIGSFWKPHYTDILYPAFHEHPPLVFIIQSYFFKLIGDFYFVEKIYSFLTLLITFFILGKLFKLFTKNEGGELYFLPILLCLILPVFTWSYKNNMLENTMGIFTLLSVYLISFSLVKKRLIWMFLSVLTIIFAFLSKGPVGLFPLITPIAFALAFERKKIFRASVQSLLLLVLTFGLLYIITLSIPELRENFLAYLHRQVIPSLKKENEVTASFHLSLLFALILELAIPILLLFLLGVIERRKHGNNIYLPKGVSLFFLLIAISASFPLMIVLKQSRVYLLPSLPFYILTISFMILPFLKNALNGISKGIKKGIWIFSTVVIIASLSYSIHNFGSYSRDEQQITEIEKMKSFIPKGSLVSTKGNCENWLLIAYLARMANYSLDCKNPQQYYLILKKDPTQQQSLPETEYEIFLDMELYQIYRKSKHESPKE